MSMRRWRSRTACLLLALTLPGAAGCGAGRPEPPAPAVATTSTEPTIDHDTLVAALPQVGDLHSGGWRRTGAPEAGRSLDICHTAPIVGESPPPIPGEPRSWGVARRRDKAEKQTMTMVHLLLTYAEAATAREVMTGLRGTARACPPTHDQPRQKTPTGGTAAGHRQLTTLEEIQVSGWDGFMLTHRRTGEWQTPHHADIRTVVVRAGNAVLMVDMASYQWSAGPAPSWDASWRSYLPPLPS